MKASADWNRMQFSNWVRSELRRREWNDSDLARRMDVNTGVLSNWLAGKRRPNPANCKLIADTFGADLDTVLALVGHRPTAKPVRIDDRKEQLIALMRSINLTDDRYHGLDGTLRSWLEMDREQKRVPE